MCDYTSNNWIHWNSNKRFKEKFGSHTRNTLDSLPKTAMLGTLHIIRKVFGRWGSLLVQVKYEEEKARDKRQQQQQQQEQQQQQRNNNNNNNIIIISTAV